MSKLRFGMTPNEVSSLLERASMSYGREDDAINGLYGFGTMLRFRRKPTLGLVEVAVFLDEPLKMGNGWTAYDGTLCGLGRSSKADEIASRLGEAREAPKGLMTDSWANLRDDYRWVYYTPPKRPDLVVGFGFRPARTKPSMAIVQALPR